MTQFASTARTSVAQSSSLTPGQKLAASALIAAGDSLSKSLITDAVPADGEAPANGVAGWSPVAITIQELPAKKGGPRNAFDVSFPQGVRLEDCATDVRAVDANCVIASPSENSFGN